MDALIIVLVCFAANPAERSAVSLRGLAPGETCIEAASDLETAVEAEKMPCAELPVVYCGAERSVVADIQGELAQRHFVVPGYLDDKSDSESD